MHNIKVLIPDLPTAEELLPWLRRIDAARWYTNFGPLVRELEQTLAARWPAAVAQGGATSPLHVVTLNTGTAPLELGIAALDLPPGAEVLLPAFTFPAVAAAILRNGLVPVFADIAPGTWQLTPELARQAAQRRRLALVMPVATFGCPVDAAGWDAFVQDTGIPVLIDAAAAFGNQAIGARATVAFSFHATKPFGIGEGGTFVTRDAALAARVRRLSNFGFEDGLAREAGGNAKLSEYAAAVALAQWRRWPERQARRQALWQAYAPALAALPGVRLQQGYDGGALPATLTASLPLPAQVVADGLAAAGIQTRRWYYPPLPRHPAFAPYPCCGPAGDIHLPVTEHLADHALGLPWFASMSAQQCAQVVSALREILEQARTPATSTLSMEA
ncbi:MAG: DegT/DnrJ/EryC1/StrS family aminotransferase [Pseudomonadota bacterium]